MSYLKDPPPIGNDLQERQAYLERELLKIQNEFNKHADVINSLVQYRIIGGIQAPYTWDDSIVMADPGAGDIRADQANLGAAVTQIAFSKTDAFGRDLGDSFGTDLAGQVIQLTDEDASNVRMSAVISAVTDNGTWLLLDVAGSEGQGNPGDGDFFTFQWYPSPSLLGLSLRNVNINFDRFANKTADLRR